MKAETKLTPRRSPDDRLEIKLKDLEWVKEWFADTAIILQNVKKFLWEAESHFPSMYFAGHMLNHLALEIEERVREMPLDLYIGGSWDELHNGSIDRGPAGA